MPVFVPAFFEPEAYNCEEAMVKTRIRNRLAETRKRRGVGAADLAGRVHVSRQTIYAIEAGTYVPNTEVALNLARELEVTVEELFSLQEGAGEPPESLDADLLSALAPAKRQPVRICQVGSRWVGIPVSASPYYLRHQVTVGLELRQDIRQQQTNYDIQPYNLYFNDHRSSGLWGLYFQDRKSVV